jgi:YVTN family beta-propeller protein
VIPGWWRPVTKTLYVTNSQDNTVSVIDTATFTVKGTVQVGLGPTSVVVNPLTNQIYVSSYTDQNVSVIDGASNTVEATIPLGVTPLVMALNRVTNMVYVGSVDYNTQTYSVTRISGTQIVGGAIPIEGSPKAMVVNPVTNKIYLTDGDTQMTMIDGVDNSIHELTIGYGNAPALAINLALNRVYVANSNEDTVSVVQGANAAPAQFVAVTPCRLYDTRPQHGGSGAIAGGTFATFNLPQLSQSKGCADLSTAAAYSLNVAVVPHGYLGYLTMWPTGEDQPFVATLNSLDGRVKGNAAILPAGYLGEISVYVTHTTDVVLDIDGYFAPVSGSTLAFYPLFPPCRVADTRKSDFPPGLGTPHLSGGGERDFPVLSSTCGIPSAAEGYSLNLTAVPYPPNSGSLLGYLELWPKDQKPGNPVSTLNNLKGTIVANAALVPAGTDGEITVYASDNTELVIDANGYFAPAGEGGLSLYPAAPCRVIDTRKIGNGQPFGGTLSPPVDVVNGVCGPPAAAQAYAFNATVIPTGGLGYLTLWPDGTLRPTVSTLNAMDESITNNMAIVPTTNGKVDAFANGITHLILDISSYFAP